MSLVKPLPGAKNVAEEKMERNIIANSVATTSTSACTGVVIFEKLHGALLYLLNIYPRALLTDQTGGYINDGVCPVSWHQSSGQWVSSNEIRFLHFCPGL